MGLDMYLYLKNKSTGECKEVMYWRKANQFREWFSKNLKDFQDEGTTPVSKSDLERLVHDCNSLLENRELAESLLPTSIGWFFGPISYSDHYFEEVERTEKVLSKLLSSVDFEKEELIYFEWY